MSKPADFPNGDSIGLPVSLRYWQRLSPCQLYAVCIALAAMTMCAAMTLQAHLFIGYFNPVFLIMPTLIGSITGTLIARILLLQRQMRKNHKTITANQLRDERYRLAMRAADFTVWDWRLDEDRVFCMQGVRNILGRDIDGDYLAADWWKSWVHPDDQAHFHDSINAHIRGRSARCECEYRARDEDGRYRWAFLQALASRDETGRTWRISGIVTDISDRKRAEIALIEAKTDAEQASRTKSEFLANISHELRTPLNAIIGFSEILKTQLFGPIGNTQYTDYATDIWQSGRHLLDIINDILDLSRIESGKMTLTTERVDLRDTTMMALRMVEEAARLRNIRVDLALGTIPQTVIGDPRALRQILLNLLSNSIKFTPDGGTVRIASQSDAYGRLSLSVSDTGIGMRPEDIPVALAPFHQIESSLARKHDGTGLGLPLAKALTELQGGSFCIESTPGKGTEVTITLSQAERAVA
jgi:signal transduction histidine kinase